MQRDGDAFTWECEPTRLHSRPKEGTRRVKIYVKNIYIYILNKQQQKKY